MTHAEMNEQVALRLGWTKPNDGRFPDCPWQSPDPGLDRYYEEELPPWSTDDGLAVSQIVPRLIAMGFDVDIHCQKNGTVRIGTQREGELHWTHGTETKIAEALCKVLIAVVPLEETK